MQLVNDPQAKDIDAKSIVCRICDQTIRFSERNPFDLEVWGAHKSNCTRCANFVKLYVYLSLYFRAPSTPAAGQHSNTVLASAVAETQLTEYDSNEILPGGLKPMEDVTSAPSIPTPTTGQKRRRDDSDDEDTSTHPATKLKTSESTVVSKPSQGILNWLLLPWEAFKHGFQESLKS